MKKVVKRMKKINLCSLILIPFNLFPGEYKEFSSYGNLSNEKFSFNFEYCGKDYQIQYNYNDSKYIGFNLVDSNGEILTIYEGEFFPTKEDDISYFSPIFSDDNCLIEGIEEINRVKRDIVYSLPYVSEEYYSVVYDSYSTYYLIKNCPFYYSDIFDGVENFCVPTSAAMLISFYDRNTDMTNLIDGLLPLNHYDDRSRVDNLIFKLADLMGWNSSGVYIGFMIYGLNMYFIDAGYNYTAYSTSDFMDYKEIISTFRNPAIVWLKNPGERIFHAVLGVGRSNIYNSGQFIATHYNISNNNLGTYYVNSSLMFSATYMAIGG